MAGRWTTPSPTSRDEVALAEALRDGRVAVPNVILTPHIAVTSRQAFEDLHRLAATYVLGLLEDAGRIPAAA